MSTADLRDRIWRASEYISKDRDMQGALLEKLRLRAGRLNDYLESLELRYNALRKAQGALTAELDPDWSLHTAQIELLDATSAFHEQAYNTISCFTLFLRVYLPHNLTRGLSLGTSMEKVIKETFRILVPMNQGAVALAILEEMRSFRSHYIVHPQITAEMEWATYSLPSSIAVYYFNTTSSDSFASTGPKDHAGDLNENAMMLRKIYPYMDKIVCPPDFEKVYCSVKEILNIILDNHSSQVEADDDANDKDRD